MFVGGSGAGGADDVGGGGGGDGSRYYDVSQWQTRTHNNTKIQCDLI